MKLIGQSTSLLLQFYVFRLWFWLWQRIRIATLSCINAQFTGRCVGSAVCLEVSRVTARSIVSDYWQEVHKSGSLKGAHTKAVLFAGSA